MTASFDFDDPDHVVADAVGPPGARVFFLQACQRGELVSFKLEKQQVAALAEYLAGILADLPATDAPVAPSAELVEPVLAEWVVGALAVAYEQSTDRILLVAEEFIPEPEDDEEDHNLDRRDDPATARLRLTRAQVQGLVGRAIEVVTSGRPLCRVCGRPMDPEGHHCPRDN